MYPIDEDDKPTVAGGSARFVSKQDRQAPLRSGGFETEDRPTMVRQKEPDISAVAWIYCLKGKRHGQLYQLKKQRNEFGRANDNDILIEDDLASNHHGAIVLEDGIWKIFDFASTNGTTVDGKRVGKECANPIQLDDGTKFAIGDTEFAFKKL
jgi:hypothetical protein